MSSVRLPSSRELVELCDRALVARDRYERLAAREYGPLIGPPIGGRFWPERGAMEPGAVARHRRLVSAAAAADQLENAWLVACDRWARWNIARKVGCIA